MWAWGDKERSYRMKVLVAMDSFKGSLTSVEAGRAVRDGILQVLPHAEIDISPLADGGEGTVDALCSTGQASIKYVSVTGPLGKHVWAKYGILDNRIGVIEIAEAAGLTLIPCEKRDPLYTTTYGVGELILDAVEKGCRDFIIGLGGSGTNDGGVGMLTALGWRFTDKHDRSIVPGAAGLKELCNIDYSCVRSELTQCRFRIACDVKNPLLGVNGCSAVFGPQKGATAQSVADMDRWMENYASVVKHHYPTAESMLPGGGAAGGLGFAFATFLGGSLEPGARIVTEVCELEKRIAECDVVITGEGCLDGQTPMGKGPIHIAQLGKKHGKEVIAFAGCIGQNAEFCLKEGVTAYYGILPDGMTKEAGMVKETAYRNLRNEVTRFFVSAIVRNKI